MPEVAKAIGIPAANVECIVPLIGGGFGRRLWHELSDLEILRRLALDHEAFVANLIGMCAAVVDPAAGQLAQ